MLLNNQHFTILDGEGKDEAKAREECCCEVPRLQGSFESLSFVRYFQ